ncbi:unnamed protein product, partial [Rotaria sp. Silwood1]
LCHIYFDLIKKKIQTRFTDFDKMRQYHKAFSPSNKDRKYI